MILELNDKIHDLEQIFPELRYGQCVFMALSSMSPKGAEDVMGTDLDPFEWKLNDDRFIKFWDWFMETYESD